MRLSVIAASVVLTMAFAGLSQAADSRPPPRNIKPYPDDLKESFVVGCTGGSLTRAACECVMRLLEPEWTEEEVTALNDKLVAEPDSEMPPLIIEIALACVADPSRKTLK